MSRHTLPFNSRNFLKRVGAQKIRKLGFVDYHGTGALTVHRDLLSVVLRD